MAGLLNFLHEVNRYFLWRFSRLLVVRFFAFLFGGAKSERIMLSLANITIVEDCELGSGKRSRQDACYSFLDDDL
jgi:hypothetical protein